MPLVLPPTVIGFYLLLALGPSGLGGMFGSLWGARTIAFSFTGLVIASMAYGLPFFVQPLQVAFRSIAQETLDGAATLGAGMLATFFSVAIPEASAGLIVSCILAFAHTLGEFGVVLMIGGAIPGKTEVMSIAIYQSVERGDWGEANILALAMVLMAFVTVTAITMLARRIRRQERAEI